MNDTKFLRSLGSLVVVACVAAVGSYYIIKAQRTEAEELVMQYAAATQQELYDLATLSSKSLVDDDIEALVGDCTNRDTFESYLVQLESLSPTELDEAQRLIEACGNYYPKRKALMVHKMDLVFKELTDFTEVVVAYDKGEGKDYHLAQWQSILDKEQERSRLMFEQVTIQSEVITALQNKDREAITSLLKQASKTYDSLNVLSIQIRNELEDITL